MQSTSSNPVSLDRQIGFAILRLMLGINMFTRSLVRLPELQSFAAGTAEGFEDTLMPQAFAYIYAFIIVGIEGIAGILLMIGWKTRWALTVVGLLLCSLAFGMLLQQNFGTAANIMIYGIAVTLLLFHSEYDGFGVDRGFKINRQLE